MVWWVTTIIETKTGNTPANSGFGFSAAPPHFLLLLEVLWIPDNNTCDHCCSFGMELLPFQSNRANDRCPAPSSNLTPCLSHSSFGSSSSAHRSSATAAVSWHPTSSPCFLALDLCHHCCCCLFAPSSFENP
jgi:hypothetical protein